MARMRRAFAPWLAFLVAVAGCEGPVGPEGPEGPTGAAGPMGPAGPAGADGNSTCLQCHVDGVSLLAIQVQYNNSIHRVGGNFERNGTSCAPCHTHQGFVEVVTTGASTTAAAPSNPAPVNCRTCHMIHDTYTDADWALRVTAPVDFMVGSHGTADLGKGNLCAQCHQSRMLSPMPAVGGPNVNITSYRYGWHHGPQGQVIAGVGAFKFAGTMTIPDGPGIHGDPVSNPGVCITCHMAEAYGAQSGGHTWNMAYDYHGSIVENVAGCNSTGCHASVEDFEYLHVQTEVETLLANIAVELQRVGIMGADHYAVTGSWSGDLAAAFANWQMFEEDRSLGLHNPDYARAVLGNTLEVLKTK